MRYKIAAMGRPDEVFPFIQIGIDTFTPQSGNALQRQVAALVKEGTPCFYEPDVPFRNRAYFFL